MLTGWGERERNDCYCGADQFYSGTTSYSMALKDPGVNDSHLESHLIVDHVSLFKVYGDFKLAAGG